MTFGLNVRWRKIVSWLFGCVLVGFGILFFEAYTDWGFVDANTGSRKGYRQWVFGIRSHSWYEKSSLESFIEASHPDSLVSRWISYTGTGRTLVGAVRSQRHGRPGIMHTLAKGPIDSDCELASDAEKFHLYNLLSSGDEEAVIEFADVMIEAITDGKQPKTEQSGAVRPLSR